MIVFSQECIDGMEEEEEGESSIQSDDDDEGRLTVES